MPETKLRHSLIAAGLTAAAILVVLALKWFHDNKDMPWALVAPSQQTAVVTRMVELRNKDQFEDAINVGLHATTGSPNDDFIYQLIATTYFIQSLHDKAHSGNWAKLGAQYSQQALDSNPNDIANVFNVGLNYIAAGDDIDKGGCEYYGRAKVVLENLAPHLQGDHAETQGRTVMLAPFRKHHAEALSEVNSRLRHCEPRSN